MRILALTFIAALSLHAADKPKAPLMAGAATSNITSEIGGDIIGGFLPFPSTHIHDELHARCLVLDDGKTKVALVVCDLLGVHRSVSVEARKLIEKDTGIPAANVLISGTHTHSATSALGESPRPFASDVELSDYQRFVARRIADGVKRAVNLLRPAEIAFGKVDAPEHVFVRRWFLKGGTMPPNPFGKIDKVKMNPGAGNANLVEPAGVPDPTVSFIALREPGGRLISVYSAYGLHYVGGVGNGHISADYYGMYCEALKKLQPGGDGDPPFVAIMANGTSGDVNNINFRNPRPSKPPYEQMRFVAEDVAGKVNAALANLTWTDSAPLDARYRELGIAWRKIDADLIKWAQETEANNKDIAACNTAWRSAAKSFEELTNAGLAVTTDAAKADVRAFVGEFMEAYFAQIEKHFRQHDRNHLLLGSRLQPVTINDEQLCRIMGRHVDVVSYNYYTYGVDTGSLRRIHEWCGGKPMMLSEFFWASSKDSGLIGGREVDSQQQRGLAYRNYVEQSAALGFVVGIEWFTLIDQATTGRWFSKYNGESYNTGLVSVADRPWKDMLAEMMKTNHGIYDVLLGKRAAFAWDDVRFQSGKEK